MIDSNRTLPWIRIRMLAWVCLLLAGSLTLMQCGQMIAGGTSEVGNPQSARYRKSKEDSTSHPVGVEISAFGNPIRVIRDSSNSER